MDVHDDDNDDDDDETDLNYGFQILLGKVVLGSDVEFESKTAFVTEDDNNFRNHQKIYRNNHHGSYEQLQLQQKQPTPAAGHTKNQPIIHQYVHCNDKNSIELVTTTTSRNIIENDSVYLFEINDPVFYSLANFSSSTADVVQKQKQTTPPVQIIYLGRDKGMGLVALQSIKKNTIIYTERAACATSTTTTTTLPEMTTKKFCANCFRSLESIESCRGIFSSTTTTSNFIDTTADVASEQEQQVYHEFPLPYLWPVIPLQFDPEEVVDNIDTGTCTSIDNETTSMDFSTTISSVQQKQQRRLRKDRYGRYQCRICNQLFCTEHCYQSFQSELGSCCCLQQAMCSLPKLLRTIVSTTSNQSASAQHDKTVDENNTDDVTENQMNDDNPNIRTSICDVISYDDQHDEDCNGDENNFDVSSSIQLAIRMFAYHLQYYRKTKTKNLLSSLSSISTDTCTKGIQTGSNTCSATNTNSTSDDSIKRNVLSDLCGDSCELSRLELGIGYRQICRNVMESTVDGDYTDNATSPCSTDGTSNNMEGVLYTVEPIYHYLIKIVWKLTKQEQVLFPCTMFELLVVQAARNGFDIQTQSPFQTYYSSLIRTIGGRNSLNHQHVYEQVLCALGLVVPPSVPPNTTTTTDTSTTTTTSTKQVSIKLDRAIDKRINEHVSVPIVGIFPLTARINHSCVPNAQVQSQVFVDYYIDIVSTCDIMAGEEITISYIQDHLRKRRQLRIRELYTKYLFTCTCPACCN